MEGEGDSEPATRKPYEEQSEAERQAARFSDQADPFKAFRHDIALGEVKQDAIDAAQSAGAPAELLERARAALEEQQTEAAGNGPQ